MGPFLRIEPQILPACEAVIHQNGDAAVAFVPDHPAHRLHHFRKPRISISKIKTAGKLPFKVVSHDIVETAEGRKARADDDHPAQHIADVINPFRKHPPHYKKANLRFFRILKKSDHLFPFVLREILLLHDEVKFRIVLQFFMDQIEVFVTREKDDVVSGLASAKHADDVDDVAHGLLPVAVSCGNGIDGEQFQILLFEGRIDANAKIFPLGEQLLVIADG